jgi:cytochrome c biogenesis protein CcmG, thiol:disulfide interchange protein DsbE
MKKVVCFLLFLPVLLLENAVAQGNYYVSTARSKEQMVQTFPFDITLKSPDGKTINSAELFKKHKEPTVLMFWLTTCYPCRMEVAAVQQKYEQWKKDAKFRLVLISYDFPQNYDNFVKRAKEENWLWESYHDVNKEFGSVLPGELNGLPQVFVFDKKGEIAYHKRKYMTGDEDILFEKIKELQK